MNVVNVWFFDVGEWVEQRFLHLLSAEEKKQAGAFKFHDDTLRYIASRGLARTVICLTLAQEGRVLDADGRVLDADGRALDVDGRVLDQNASELRFAEGPFGKPSLPDFPDFHFNSSHAGGKVVIATSRHPVGVDIESTSNCRLINSDLEKVLLSQSQIESLDRIYSGDRNDSADPNASAGRKREVLRLWVHKEAYLKAIGTGLSISPKEIELVAGANSSFQIITPKEQSRDSNNASSKNPSSNNASSKSANSNDASWFSQELKFDGQNNEFVGAVVKQGSDWSVNYFDFAAVLGNMKAKC